MATTNRKKTTSSQGTRKRTNTRASSAQKNGKKNNDFSSFYVEIAVLVSIAIMILMMLSNFGLCGAFGNSISAFFFGIFGWVQYILPILSFVGLALLIANNYSSLAVKKVIIGILFCAMLSTLIQMAVDIEGNEFLQIFAHSAKYKTGGGIIGGAFTMLLHNTLGTVGAYVVVLLVMIICLVLITERSFLSLIKRGGGAVYNNVKEARDAEVERINNRPIREPKESRFSKNPAATNDIFTHSTVLPESIPAPETKSKRKSKKKSEQEMRELTINQMIPDSESMISPMAESKKISQSVQDLSIQSASISVTSTLSEPISSGSIQSKTLPMESSLPEIFHIEPVEIEPLVIEPVIIEPAIIEPEIIEPKEQPLPKVETRIQPKKAQKAEDDNELLTVKTASIDTGDFVFPPIRLLEKGKNKDNADNQETLRATALKLQQTLENFGVRVTMTNVSCGPSVTRYEMQPEQGVKVSRIVSLADDIKLNLAAADIRIEAPIPGKAAVGIEVPNKTNTMVTFRELIDNVEFKKYPSDIAFAVGKDIGGKIIVTDIGKMPHLLIAGATGSGKSVCINTLIMSILYKAKPSDVKLIMIDPKVVELSTYNGIPHLLIPVVTDPKKASSALNWAVMEMTDRYKKFAEYNVRNLKGYNKKVEEILAEGEVLEEELVKLPLIVIIVDELADLMMVAPGEVEDAIVRLSQLARAAGIHLVIATQRPSVNVITGLIKANVPSRIAFSVSSGVDSRTIIDMNGAEKLLGKGDMLFYPSGYQKPVRVQGAFISDKEVMDVVEFLKEQGVEPEYNEEISAQISSQTSTGGGKSSDRDDYFVDAGRFIIDKDKASIGMLQRVYKIGFNRAARIMDQLSEAGVVGPEEGTKPRKVLMSLEEFEQYVEEYV